MAIRLSTGAMATALTLGFVGAALAQSSGDLGPREFPDDPFVPASVGVAASDGPAQVWVRRAHTSIQVNVTALGQNIVGDAANEPSIAIDPLNPSRIVIGWRQFDTVVSNFRQAGVAYSHDGGQTWTKNTLTPGYFRSDPVLGADNAGNFFYSSLPNLNAVEVFKSINGGVTWATPVNSFGGDKQWMTIDRTGGIGDGYIHQIWNIQFTCCEGKDFTRSVNGGVSFPAAYGLPLPSMKWGTLDVGPDGVLYFGGSNLGQTGHLTARCSNCNNGAVAPIFDFVQSVNLGGTTSFGTGPNEGGLLGQVWIATDHSAGPTRGNVYMLASVNPLGTDPLDVMFIRSTDGGMTWSVPVRVNDDLAGTNAWQWFGTMSVAPNGRIDVIWNDTRNDPVPADGVFFSEVFHSFSLDGGVTWSANTGVTPPFNPHLGYPNQNKIGDYYHMISDNDGAGLAFAATFNGEQDVYFLRIPADCDGDGTDDLTEYIEDTASDCNENSIPDQCEYQSDVNGDGLTTLADFAPYPAKFTGPEATALDLCDSLLDNDHDSDIDLRDFAGFQRAFTGP